MQIPIKAVIFDMDGVLIDSEPYWRLAMIKGFKEVGLNFTDEDCRQTTGMRLKEVIEFWFQRHSITQFSVADTNSLILDYLTEFIEKDGKEMLGVSELLTYLKANNYKIGLATSSDERFMNTVVIKLKLSVYFDAIVSAQKLQYAKPHPDVFLKCAEALGVLPQQCLVIEDSVNGVIAGKAASMRVIAVPEKEFREKNGFKIADKLVENLREVKGILTAIRQ
jgi:mannitol-1-/sugar-/sorbitol-6-/2-deoxyglucose-6-phosphatase